MERAVLRPNQNLHKISYTTQLSFKGRVDAGSKGGFMTAVTLKDKINLSHAKAIIRSREQLKVTRIELACRLNLSPKSIEKYESGRAIIDEEKLQSILNALDLEHEDFEKIRRGKGCGVKKKKKTVYTNQERRSYRRIITKEVRVLRILRQMKNFSQDQASSVCGYSRPSIGHIENGRIELDQDRIRHVVECYRHPISAFERLMKEEVIRDEVYKNILEKMKNLSEEKLKLVNSLVDGMCS
jgi:transcriptional regulator with XRE-family HTH domain